MGRGGRKQKNKANSSEKLSLDPIHSRYSQYHYKDIHTYNDGMAIDED